MKRRITNGVAGPGLPAAALCGLCLSAAPTGCGSPLASGGLCFITWQPGSGNTSPFYDCNY